MANKWETEPNIWRGERCLALRQENFKHWCGYIAIPPGHPWHGMSDSLIPCSVHGGLTYAAQHEPSGDYEHTDDWWIGFDCAHAYDYVPGFSINGGLRDNYSLPSAVYRDLEYVKKEIMYLMEQAVAAAHGRDLSGVQVNTLRYNRGE